MPDPGAPHSAALPRISGYTIERLLDTGGFSRVYLANQHGLDRSVAIKVLNSTFEDDRQQLIFDRECKVMGQLSSHSNIVTVFASAMTESAQPCIVMELYDGTYRTEGTLDVKEVVHVGAQVADALQTIHDRNIVHRDIKPHNIFISTNGVPAIGDFGISSIENERTVTGAAGFSMNYAPPEVFEDGGAGASGDVYSLGATLYQLATGAVPFPHTGDPADRVRATVHRIITAAPPSLDLASAPAALDRLLRKCMAKRASERPATPADVAIELRRIQREIGFPDRRERVAPHLSPGPNETEQGDSSRTESRTVLREVTNRPGPSRTDDATKEVDAAESRSPTSRVRGGVMAASIAAIVIVAGALALTRTDKASDSSPAIAATTPTDTAADLIILSPPENVEVTRSPDGSSIIDWTVDDPDLKYQISEVGSPDIVIVTTAPYIWLNSDDAGSDCFEIRAVNGEETKMSQSASTPVCAS